MKWYFQATADWFGGFLGPDWDPPADVEGWHGPFETFADAKAAASAYYLDVISQAKQAFSEVRRTKELKRTYAKPRDPLELDAEHDQHPERSPAR